MGIRIKVLSDQVINQIAAGEVIERPSSVLRELLDNSVDAGATDVSVYLERGGISAIKVSDNGSGMSRDDAITCFERHATSKISSSDQLVAISTLGFRGEALPSIASVSKVRLRTREQDAELGTEVVIEGGKLKEVSAVACSRGCEFEIRALFFNTPARRKFLKSPETEEARCETLLMQYSLAHPGVKFGLVCDGKEKLHIPKSSNSSERMKLWLRGAVADVGLRSEGIKVFGLIGHPAGAASTTGQLALLVNGRLVKDRLLLKAIRQGFGFTLKSAESPLGIVAITIAPEEVDVNVHPQKSEVRFRSPQKVFQAVEQAVAAALSSLKLPVSTTILSQDSSAFRSFDAVRPSGSAFGPPESNWEERGEIRESPVGTYNFPQKLFDQIAPVNNFTFSNLRYLAQLFDCFLLCQAEDRFYVVDMHAAHERYNFNLVRNRMLTRDLPSQGLLTPVVLQLSPKQRSYLLNHAGLLDSFGFQIEDFGGNSVAVRSVPAVVNPSQVEVVLREIADLDIEAVAQGRISRELDSIAARIACHGSIRSGRKMERDEVYALFEALDRSEFSAACPHGRPVVVSFSESEVEKWFGRDR